MGLYSLCLRRTWTERQDLPLYSKYTQSLIELCTSLYIFRQQFEYCPDGESSLGPKKFPVLPSVDASMPSCNNEEEYFLAPRISTDEGKYVDKTDHNFIARDDKWDLWSGTVQLDPFPFHQHVPPVTIPEDKESQVKGVPPLLDIGMYVKKSPDYANYLRQKKEYRQNQILRLKRKQMKRQREKQHDSLNTRPEEEVSGVSKLVLT